MTAYSTKSSKVVDMKNLAVQLDQIQDKNGNVVLDTTTMIASGATFFGAGTSSAQIAIPAGGGNLLQFYAKGTTGPLRAIYARLYFNGTGGGEAVRAYGTLNNVTGGVGSTLNGAHISFIATGSSAHVSGAAHALRATFEIDDTATAIGGTCDIVHIDTSFTSTPTKPTRMSFIGVDNLSSGKLDYFLNITNPSTTMVAAAGTGANSAAVSTGGVASKVIKVTVDGTDYWLPLFSSNS